MIWRFLRRRRWAGFRFCRTDVFYIALFFFGFFFISTHFGGGPYSDARAISKPPRAEPPHVLSPLPKQGYEVKHEEEAEMGAEKEQAERQPQHVQPVLKRPHSPPAPGADVFIQPVQPVQPLARFAGAPTPKVTKGNRHAASSGILINGQPYPKLTPAGNFVPLRRIVHLDLKGAPPKASVFTEIFFLLNRMRATGVLIEWEDMFPFQGRLKDAVNGNAYSMEEVEMILSEARKHHLEIIPLVQTFGHLEWILKLEKFSHLRDDPRTPQVICIGKDEAWEMLREMIDEVAAVHSKYGMNYFHIGADEVFSLGTCNETAALMRQHGGSRERVTLFHIARVAEYVKCKKRREGGGAGEGKGGKEEKAQTTMPLAWHDMLVHSTPSDIATYRLPELLEPVLWSYAEDLEQFLPYSTWEALQPFPRVWGSSAWKGADGPMRFHSRPIHYIRNHESWTRQFTRVYKDFEVVQGLIMTGWSRYDHLAILAETIPVGIPSLAMSMETVIEARPMGGKYPFTEETLQCTAPLDAGFAYGCTFPGRKVYELVNSWEGQRRQLKQYAESDFELQGWLSTGHAEKYAFSSAMYIQKILPFLEYYEAPVERLVKDLRREMGQIFYEDALDEFLETYIEEDLMFLRRKIATAKKILARTTFEKRPFVKKRPDL